MNTTGKPMSMAEAMRRAGEFHSHSGSIPSGGVSGAETRALSSAGQSCGVSSSDALSPVLGLSSCGDFSAGLSCHSSAYSRSLVADLLSRGGVLMNGGRRYAVAAAMAAAIGLQGGIAWGTDISVSNGETISGKKLGSGVEYDAMLMYISSGGTANATSVYRWGNQYLSSGGVANDTVISSGGNQYVGDDFSGGVASNTTIGSGGSQAITSGGSALTTTVNNGGKQTVGPGGFASGTTIASGGLQQITSVTVGSGTASDTTISFGGVLDVRGSADGVVIHSGGELLASAANAKAINVSQSVGGVLTTRIGEGNFSQNFSGVEISGTNGLGNAFSVSNNVASNVILYSSAKLEVYSTASATGTIISGGTQIIYNGGTATDSIINSGGILQLQGSTASASISGAVEGELQGWGTVSGAVTIADGGKLVAGGAYHKSSTANYEAMTISGDLTIASGGTLAARVDHATSACDSVTVTGSATVSGASFQHVANLTTSTDYAGGSWTILTADGGVTGEFGDVGSDLVFLTPTLTYNGKDVILSFDGTSGPDPDSPASPAMPTNNLSLYRAVFSLDSTGPLMTLLKNNVTDGNLNQVMGDLTGDIHASIVGGMMTADRGLSQGVITRFGRKALAEAIVASAVPAFGEARAFASINPRDRGYDFANKIWADVGYARQKTDGDGATGVGGNTLKGPEVSIGYDHIAPSGWLGGVSFHFADRKLDQDDRQFESNIDSYSVALHTGFQTCFGSGVARFLIGGAYTYHDIDSTRDIRIGSNRQRLEADYHANSYQMFMEGAYAIPLGRIWLEPYVDLNWTSLHTKSFRERGGVAALRASSDSQNNVAHTVGARLVIPATARVTFETQAGWRHTYGTLDSEHSFAFAEGSNTFGVRGAAMNRDEAVFDLKADYRVRDNLRLGLEGNASVGNRGHSVRGGAFVAVEW